MRTAAVRYGKRTAARIRAIRRKAAEWKRLARRALTLAMVTAGLAAAPSPANAQMGQMGMAPTGGIVNRAVAGVQGLNENGPGWLYYGLNAADRGLGYNGGYMTLGGFIPYAQDDFGGLWAADLRGHLSEYGGFFSNLGAVRKQFIGGTLFGVGVYWDYDGDQNQNPDTFINDSSGSYLFPGGQTYQQVGISGEWLTDYGNLRSNGYIPVGTVSGTMGPLVGHSLLCQSGINAALGGADLEVGAYVPGLADWAGMISVGGYAYGNSEELANTEIVPWFGGVYTRLDMTFLENWDFSLQANNDSYFDWTGFARLTYRLGSSRRRNVPDQMEQPMMRNEHIVRAYQAPIQAINPVTNAPWFVIHVDNSDGVAAGGTGTAETPFRTLAEAQNAATNPYDIVFVRTGVSATNPYLAPGPTASAPEGGFRFLADNQYLVGEGTTLRVPTANCGLTSIWSDTTATAGPRITNPNGPAIILTDSAIAPGTTTGATVNNITIVGSKVGISDGGGLPTGGRASVSDVQIIGTGPNQRGVEIDSTTGNNAAEFEFRDMTLQNMTNDGFAVSGSSGQGPRVAIVDSSILDTTGSGVVVSDLQGAGTVSISNMTVSRSSDAGVFVGNGNASIRKSTFLENSLAGVFVQDANADGVQPAAGDSTAVQVSESVFDGASVGIWGSSATATGVVNLTITGNRIRTTSIPAGANGIILAVGNAGSQLNASVVNNVIDPRVQAFDPEDDPPYSPLGNIVLATQQGALNIKASSREQLESMNRRAGVATQPLPATPGPPPPPNYAPALVVPLPPP